MAEVKNRPGTAPRVEVPTPNPHHTQRTSNFYSTKQPLAITYYPLLLTPLPTQTMPGASTTQRYHRVLVYFMRYRDQVEYEFGHEFAREDLAAVVPNDLIRYFKFRLYDNPDADTDIEKPKCRSNALKGWNKSISYFMPNSHMVWNEIANVGNPTKAKEINTLIGQVKRKEAARRGAPSKKRRGLL